jgi:CRP/FNR family transcriptional regulator, cyclic AMP receptor protein
MAQPAITEGLTSVDLFSGLSRRDLERIARSGREVDHKPGQEVVTQGRSGIGFHLVLGGSADLEIGGRIRKRLGAGDYFGEISLLDGKPRTATVRAGEDGLRTFAITASQFQGLLKEQPQVARALLITLCARIRDTEAASSSASR